MLVFHPLHPSSRLNVQISRLFFQNIKSAHVTTNNSNKSISDSWYVKDSEIMSATSSGGRGRGRGTTAVVSAVGKGKVGQTTPPSTVPPEIEEIVRAQKREMEGNGTSKV